MNQLLAILNILIVNITLLLTITYIFYFGGFIFLLIRPYIRPYQKQILINLHRIKWCRGYFFDHNGMEVKVNKNKKSKNRCIFGNLTTRF